MTTQRIDTMESVKIEQTPTQQLLNEIIRKGYQRAAASFSTMIGTQVTADQGSFIEMVSDRDVITNRFNERQNITMIVTSIIGQLRGESYLLLTDKEEEVICQMCRKAFGGATLQNELVLKEIDNIISAAVITEFSNRLSIRIYGDVPHLYHLRDTQLWKSAVKIDDNDDCFIMANASFGFAGQVSITPSFIWRFEKKLINLIEAKIQLL